MKKIFFLIGLIVSISIYGQKFNQLALTPPLGWNSWNKFACDVNEEMIRQIADAMVSSGMKDAGYQYIVIDDCWHGQRDSLGFIHPDAKRFPSGIKALADYVHSKGLKFGIYSDAGAQTCGGRPGSRGHEYQDAITYAKWGVDYLKYDWCNTDNINAKGAYTTMRDALYASGRPVLFSMCEWGSSKPWEWAKETGHMWRATGDIYPCFDCEMKHPGWSQWGVIQILDMQKDLRNYAAPGHWNDPDMLEVGNGMTVNEDRAHFSMWCMLTAPLIAGNDLRNMNKETNEILTNREVLAIDQDSLGIECFKYRVIDSVEIFAKPLKGGDWAITFLNRSVKIKKIEFDWKQQNIVDDFFKKEIKFEKDVYNIRDLWAKKPIGKTDKPLKADIPGHDVLMVRLSK
jgi:alpha-galactosidase